MRGFDRPNSLKHGHVTWLGWERFEIYRFKKNPDEENRTADNTQVPLFVVCHIKGKKLKIITYGGTILLNVCEKNEEKRIQCINQLSVQQIFHHISVLFKCL